METEPIIAHTPQRYVPWGKTRGPKKAQKTGLIVAEGHF